MSNPVYPFIAVDVPASLAEVAAEQLFELGAEGVEQRDTTTLIRGAQSGGAQLDPGADVGAPSAAPEASSDEIVTLVAAFATRESALEALEAFGPELNPRLEEVVGDAWRDAWKEHFAPFRLSRRIVVKPPWREVETSLLDGDTHVLELEPGRAFGTGLHATTSLVANVLDARSELYGGQTILDVGCGSGILALCALSLGAARARCVDIDPDAVRVTIANAARTGFGERVDADTTDVAAITETYPLVVANIQAEVLVPRALDVIARVAPGGVLVLSGILDTQRDRLLEAYRSLTIEEVCVLGEWIAIVARKPA